VKPIWYFAGLLLMAMGTVIILTGVYLVIYPPVKTTVLANTHPNLWWGGIMVVAGILLYFKNKNVVVQND